MTRRSSSAGCDLGCQLPRNWYGRTVHAKFLHHLGALCKIDSFRQALQTLKDGYLRRETLDLGVALVARSSKETQSPSLSMPTGTARRRRTELARPSPFRCSRATSRAGTVFASEGDLSGIGALDRIRQTAAPRRRRAGLAAKGNPTEFHLGDSGLGTPLRAAVTSFGPILLSEVPNSATHRNPSFHWSSTMPSGRTVLLDLLEPSSALTSGGKGRPRASAGVEATVGSSPDLRTRGPGRRRVLRRTGIRHR